MSPSTNAPEEQPSSDKIVGARIRELRTMRRLTQKKLADHLSATLPDTGERYAQKTISLIENGLRQLKFAEAEGIAAALGVDLSALSVKAFSNEASFLVEAHVRLDDLDTERQRALAAVEGFSSAWDGVGSAIDMYRAEARRSRSADLADELQALKEAEQEILEEMADALESLVDELRAAREEWEEDCDGMLYELCGEVEDYEEESDYEVGDAAPLKSREARKVAEGHDLCAEFHWTGEHFGKVHVDPDQWESFTRKPQSFFDRIREHYEPYLAQPEVIRAATRGWVGMAITMPNMYSTFLLATRRLADGRGGSMLRTVLREDVEDRLEAALAVLRDVVVGPAADVLEAARAEPDSRFQNIPQPDQPRPVSSCAEGEGVTGERQRGGDAALKASVLTVAEAEAVADERHPRDSDAGHEDLGWSVPHLNGLAAPTWKAAYFETVPDLVMEPVLNDYSQYFRSSFRLAEHQWVGKRYTNPEDGNTIALASKVAVFANGDKTVLTILSFYSPAEPIGGDQAHVRAAAYFPEADGTAIHDPKIDHLVSGPVFIPYLRVGHHGSDVLGESPQVDVLDAFHITSEEHREFHGDGVAAQVRITGETVEHFINAKYLAHRDCEECAPVWLARASEYQAASEKHRNGVVDGSYYIMGCEGHEHATLFAMSPVRCSCGSVHGIAWASVHCSDYTL